MGSLRRIFWLGVKELRSVVFEPAILGLLVFFFSFMVYSDATSIPENVNNASIAILDEDKSALSRQIANAFYPPYFQKPVEITADELNSGMDRNAFMFALVIPPRFEANLRKGRQTELLLNIDATAMLQAGIGDGYLQAIIQDEIANYLAARAQVSILPSTLIVRRAFNPNGTQAWFSALTSLLDLLSISTIMLTGAALVREREHGTIEHLLVMPLTAFEIAAAKVWANGLVIITCFFLSITLVVQGILDVPVAGSRLLLFGGAALYLFALAAIGIFLATLSKTMAQFALLMMMTILPMSMLSGGMSPIESQPEIIQPITWFLPSRHFMSFAQAVVFRGAGLDVVWPQIGALGLLGVISLAGSLRLFRRMLAAQQ